MLEISNHPKYRPDIDGLRALAVLSIVLYHGFPNVLPGGFIGVDVFFVISGFLITTIIFQSLNKNSFSIGEFYSRRIRRIFPALGVVLLSVLLFGWFCLYPEEIKQLGKHLAASSGFIQNFALWQESGYFDNTSDTKPLLHIWSLGVEEQFYIIYPLFIIAIAKLSVLANLARYRRVLYLFGLIALFVGSFNLNVNLVKIDSIKTFYLPQYRFFELTLGGLLSWLVVYQPKFSISFSDSNEKIIPDWLTEERVKNVLSFLGLAILLILLAKFNKDTVFPGKKALLPTFATAFIIFAGGGSWINKKILSQKYLVWFGLISYPLYLWHWPIFSYGRIIYGEIPSTEFRILAIAVSILLAWLTAKFVEKPFRFNNNNIAIKITVLCAMVFGIGGVGLFIKASNGLPGRFDGTTDRESLIPTVTLGQPKEAKIMLLGDSHAAHFSYGLKKVIGENLVADHSYSGCIPFYYTDRYDYRMKIGTCENKMMTSLKEFESNRQMTGIILSSMGPGNLDGTSFGDTDLERVKGLGVTNSLHPEIKDRWEIYKIGLTDTLKRLSALNKKILFVFDVPELGFYVQECIHPRPMSRQTMRKDCWVAKSDYQNRVKRYRELVQDVLANFPNVQVFDPSEFLCDDSICRAKDGLNFIYRDCDHLSDYGSAILVEKMKPLILNLMSE